MIGKALILGALVASGHTKFVLTNHCGRDVYVWSMPEQSNFANNLALGSGERYEEPWHYGTDYMPGIAIKISTEDNGLWKSASEIDFAYSIDPKNPFRVWMNLATIRGNDFDASTLHTSLYDYKVDCPKTDSPMPSRRPKTGMNL